MEANWIFESGRWRGYPHFAETADWFSENALTFPPSNTFGWGLNSARFGGYAHPHVASARGLWGLPLRFHSENFGWRHDAEAFKNYPHVYHRELIPPDPPPPPCPELEDISLSVPGRYVGSETDVSVTVGLQDALEGDAITILLYRYGTIHYESSVTLAENAETFTHTIPADAFVGLAVGSFVVRAKLSRAGEEKGELAADYAVVATPTAAFESITPYEIQLPIAAPKTISSQWQLAGESINRIQGNATLGALHSTAIDISNQTFSANFSNVTDVAVGEHSIAINLTVTSNRYGTATVSGSQNNVLTVLAPIPEPEITEAIISSSGRYIGHAVPVIVNVWLAEIRDADEIIIRVRQGANIFYEHTAELHGGLRRYNRTIAMSVFAGLAVGVYSVQVVIVRNGTIRDQTLLAYRSVALPTVQLLYVTPNTIQLPQANPETVMATFQIAGEGVSGIVGTVSLNETAFSANVNISDMQFSVSLVAVSDLLPQGYAISANLTLISGLYGAVTVSETFHNAFRVLEEIVPVYRNLRSNTVYIYDGFRLVHILQNYISLKWVRRYNRSGEFTLQLPNTPETVALAKVGYIVAKDNDDEAAFIEDVTIGENIEIRGGFISTMLSRRVVNFTSENLVNLQSTADSIVSGNFINTSTDRIIPGLRIADYSISAQSTLARIENGSMEAWLENQDVGFKVAFKPTENAFEFSLYDGRLSAATFCENFRNITDKQFFNQHSQARNVVIVEGADEQRITIGNAQGLERREAYARAGRFHPVEFGHQFLRQNEPTVSLDVKIVDPYSPFQYKADYDIGDIVTIVSESYGVTITQNIMEITEFYDQTGFHLYVVFGRVPRDLLTELRDNSHRIDDLENHPEPPPLDLELIKDLIIPPLLEEVFDLIEFPPLPDWLTKENLVELITETSEEVVERRLLELLEQILPEILPPIIGGGGHIILDRLPNQPQIDSFEEGSVVLVYNPDSVFTPLS